MTQEFETIIGLEVHVQLRTRSKLFCGCSFQFGAPENTKTCPICLGMPGILPALNTQAVDFGVRAALAFNCKIADFTKFDRKNYFYPDLPKAYQISQFDKPFSFDGHLEIETDEGPKRIGITRIHLEEDAGKSLHPERGEPYTRIDLNRAGVPLLEMVSEPDLRRPEDAYIYLNELKRTVKYLGVSDCDMEKGSLRCDANVSVRPKGQKEFGTKVEIKNLNSFKNVQSAIEWEVERHVGLWKQGKQAEIRQETRLWDAQKKETRAMRSKEQAHDYRYFPEPDILPLKLRKEYVDKIRAEIPELPAQKRRRFVGEYGLSAVNAGILTDDRDLANYFEQVIDHYDEPQSICNWLLGDVMRIINEKKTDIVNFSLGPADLAELVKIADSKEITNTAAKEVLEAIVAGEGKAADIVVKRGLKKVTDTGAIEAAAKQAIAENPSVVEQYKGGKTSTIGFFVGKVMKTMGGKSDPNIAKEILTKLLDS